MAASPLTLEDVRAVRRRTLIGAAVLLALGGLGFVLPSPDGFPVFIVAGVLFTTLAMLYGLAFATDASAIRAIHRQRVVFIPRDAASTTRVCSKCGAPLPSATWASGGAAGGAVAPLVIDGERCDRCGGPAEPATRRRAAVAERDALLEALAASRRDG